MQALRRRIARLGIVQRIAAAVDIPIRRTRRQLLRRLPKKAVGAEVGVHCGDFSSCILRWCNPEKLYLIDPWAVSDSEGCAAEDDLDRRHRSVLRRFAGEIDGGRVVVLRQPSADALPQLPDGSLDWIYIDGDHSFEAVRQDLELGWRAVKPGGWMGGDDYTCESVRRAVDEFCLEREIRLHWCRGSQFLLRVDG